MEVGEEALVVVGPVRVVGTLRRLEDAVEGIVRQVPLGAARYLADERTASSL